VVDGEGSSRARNQGFLKWEGVDVCNASLRNAAAGEFVVAIGNPPRRIFSGRVDLSGVGFTRSGFPAVTTGPSQILAL
jgi:hypothetical protein